MFLWVSKQCHAQTVSKHKGEKDTSPELTTLIENHINPEKNRDQRNITVITTHHDKYQTV